MKQAIVSILLLSILAMSACSSSKGSGGRKQPKKGPIPCPLKDC